MVARISECHSPPARATHVHVHIHLGEMVDSMLKFKSVRDLPDYI
jgi:hypothetical protein